MKRLICFDAESNGLHGEAFAVGAVVMDDGSNAPSEKFFARCPIEGEVVEWVRDNVLPPLAQEMVTHDTPREMRDAFWSWLTARTDGAMVVVDFGWPVETNLLSACVADDPSRAFEGPFPLHEVASLLRVVGHDPHFDHTATVLAPNDRVRLRKHHPVDDALVSVLRARMAFVTSEEV